MRTLDLPIPARSSLHRSAAGRHAPVIVAAAALVLGAAYLRSAVSLQQAALLLVGGLAGIVLYHAAFGFTAAWRVSAPACSWPQIVPRRR